MLKIDITLSDLFFNHPHPEMERLWDEAHAQDRCLSSEEQKQAILEDAREFLENYGRILPDCTADELAEDFMARV